LKYYTYVWIVYSIKSYLLPSLKISYKYPLLLGLLLIPLSCSVEKNTGASRFYHGMTAKYNIYFNGYESFKAGVIKVTESYRDDYAELLRVFEFSDPATASLCSSDMERAIQKASKLISLKSITAKPEIKGKDADRDRDLLERKEYNQWVDDSYLLIGKSRFYKHEFNEATSVLQYCTKEANDPYIRKEAAIWLSRIQNERGKYADAFRTLSELDINDDSPASLESMYYSTLADHFIKQKKFSEAIDPLEKVIRLVAGKRSEYRFTYLLAQLNGYAGNSARAIDLYRKVVKMNPPYDVEFNARINIAGVFDVNSGNTQNLRRELEKMLRDSKNKEFLDQIYYALGNLSMKEGDEAEAVVFFRKSASSSSSNPNQKGRSYLAMADYFYNKPDFISAGKYYDSTVYFLDSKNPAYQTIRTKSLELNILVEELKIIQKEDSLQHVASMEPGERNALITKIISDAVEKESKSPDTEYADRYNIGQYYENERRFQGNIEQEGKWYFYNQAALTFGRTEFKRRWGDRKLEDNWRRSNKARVNITQAGGGADEIVQSKADSGKSVLDFKSPEFYLKNLPLTDSMLALSNERIAGAYLNAGKAYADKLSDPVHATETFEKLISRYPENVLVPEALYNLCRVNKESYFSKSEVFRQRLIEKFPSSEFAKILSDPAYYEKKMANMKMAENIYHQAFETYTGENFTETISICDSAIINFPQDLLVPKFMLLRAYSVARISDERVFKEELNKLIKAFPGTEESTKALELIAYLNQKLPELKIEEEKEIAEGLFAKDTSAVHVFTLIIENPAFNINLATFDVISYNIDNYTNNNYRTEGMLVENKYIMINVSGFDDFMKVMDYYRSFMLDKIVRNPSGANMYTFIISRENLTVLNTDKNPGRYLLFFKENYLE
jgi:tetratricopeptide (TPR) repeat protein